MFYINGSDDPQCFATVFALGARASVTKKEARVVSWNAYPADANTPRKSTYPLKISYFPADMPLETALYTKRAVLWFFEKGSIPQLVGSGNLQKMTFIQEGGSSLFVQGLLRQCDAITKKLSKFMKTGQKDETSDWYVLTFTVEPGDFKLRVALIFTLLEELRKNLRESRFDLAKFLIEKLYDLTSKGFIFKELYADLLAFLNDRQALDLYLELSDHVTGSDESVLFFEKALRCDPANEKFL